MNNRWQFDRNKELYHLVSPPGFDTMCSDVDNPGSEVQGSDINKKHKGLLDAETVRNPSGAKQNPSFTNQAKSKSCKTEEKPEQLETHGALYRRKGRLTRNRWKQSGRGSSLWREKNKGRKCRTGQAQDRKIKQKPEITSTQTIIHM